MSPNNTDHTPWWMTAIIILCMIPALTLLTASGAMPGEGIPRLLVWFYPAYVLLSGWCAWACYGDRPWLSWILLVLMLMSHGAMYMLISESR